MLSTSVRNRLNVQGYACVDDETLARVQNWLRFSPALCAAIAAIGTALASPAILWSLMVLATIGALAPVHPFDLIYNLGIRRLTHTPALPANGAPRRFACGLGAVWLGFTGLLFTIDANAAGYAVGALLVATAMLVSTTHICIPSLMYGLLFGRPRASIASGP